MKFIIQQKAEKYIVSNDTTGVVRGIHKTKEEAAQQAAYLQKEHDKGIEMASGGKKPAPKDSENNKDSDGE